MNAQQTERGVPVMPRSATRLSTIVPLALAASLAWAGDSDADPAAPHQHTVSTIADGGPGSLRAALEAAQRTPGPDRIDFGDRDGPFATPQTIVLGSPLPRIEGEVSIDGRIPRLLWRAYGVTISGGGRHRIFDVAADGRLHLQGITLVDGASRQGGAIRNRGWLAMHGVTAHDNHARADGGALANEGEAHVINSTFVANRARWGGAIANRRGSLRLVNSTLHGNQALHGAALSNAAGLMFANSILAGEAAPQCVNRGTLAPASTHNLVTSHDGCGEPLRSDDPRLEPLAYYNGPTRTMPPGGGSPVINLGDNAAALDEYGQPLVWDQRGNGDPRYVAGYTDLGAFEQQAFPDLVVDTIEDTGLRACTLVGVGDCPLRAALELAGATARPAHIRFKPEVFAQPQTLRLASLPPGAVRELVLDAEGAAPVLLQVPADDLPWQAINGVRLQVVGPAGASMPATGNQRPARTPQQFQMAHDSGPKNEEERP